MPDLVDQMHEASHTKAVAHAVNEMSLKLNKLDEGEVLIVLRDLILDQLYIQIDKFPEETQKEMLAIMAHRYLTKFAK